MNNDQMFWFSIIGCVIMAIIIAFHSCDGTNSCTECIKIHTPEQCANICQSECIRKTSGLDNDKKCEKIFEK